MAMAKKTMIGIRAGVRMSARVNMALGSSMISRNGVSETGLCPVWLSVNFVSADEVSCIDKMMPVKNRIR